MVGEATFLATGLTSFASGTGPGRWEAEPCASGLASAFPSDVPTFPRITIGCDNEAKHTCREGRKEEWRTAPHDAAKMFGHTGI